MNNGLIGVFTPPIGGILLIALAGPFLHRFVGVLLVVEHGRLHDYHANGFESYYDDMGQNALRQMASVGQ